MFTKRTKFFGLLVGAGLAGVLIWTEVLNADGAPAPMTDAARAEATPGVSLHLLASGILGISVEAGRMSPAGLSLQRDGTILLGAMAPPKYRKAPSETRGIMLRLDPDGRLKPPGVTLLADAPMIVSNISTARDGTTTVAGYGGSDLYNRHMLLARLLPDGAMDPSFGRVGVIPLNTRSGLDYTPRAIATDRDGRIVATGAVAYSTGPFSQAAYCATARFTRDGRVDESFGDKGRILGLLPGKTSCGSVSALLAPDGDIVVVASAFSEGPPGIHHIATLHYGSGGKLEGAAELQMEATAWDAVADLQARIVVTGTEWLTRTRTEFLLARFDPHGDVDRSFGEGGAVSFHEANIPQTLQTAAVQQDGKIVAVGTIGWHSGQRIPEPAKRDRIVIARLDQDGALDRSFGDGGMLVIASPRYLLGARRIAIQPDGKLLILGYVDDQTNNAGRPSVVLVRLNPDGTPDATFGSGLPPP